MKVNAADTTGDTAWLSKEYDAACRMAKELYRPGERSDAWVSACKVADRLWRDLVRVRSLARAG